jgi:polyphosphate kinase
VSWLEFNQRVLDQNDDRHPLLERLKFLAIVGSNLTSSSVPRCATPASESRTGV